MTRKYNNKPARTLFYQETVKDTKGCCMICGVKGRLVIDHDHQNGNLRGLLCYRHNAGLGMFQDRPELLEKAADYLRNSNVWVRGLEQKRLEKIRNLNNKEAVVIELMEDLTFSSDRARARVLTEKLGCTEAAAQTKISKARRRKLSEARLSRGEGPKNAPYNSNSINKIQGQKIEV